jgi:hypothetical protein
MLEETIVKWLSCRTATPKRPVVKMIEYSSDETTDFTLQWAKWKIPYLDHSPHGFCMELWNQSYIKGHNQNILSQPANQPPHQPHHQPHDHQPHGQKTHHQPHGQQPHGQKNLQMSFDGGESHWFISSTFDLAVQLVWRCSGNTPTTPVVAAEERWLGLGCGRQEARGKATGWLKSNIL